MPTFYKIANIATDDMTGKVVKALTMVYGTLNNSAVRLFQSAGTNYQVTAGKTFYPVGVYVYHDNTAWTAGCVVALRYADNAALTTNPVDLGLTIGFYQPIAQSPDPFCYPVSVNVPATKYIGIIETGGTQASGTSFSLLLIGYEA